MSHKDAELGLYKEKLDELSAANDQLTELSNSLQCQLDCVRQELEFCNKERTQLELALEDSKTEALKERDGRLAAEGRIEKMETSLRSDKKYRELRERVSNYEKEVDSLNVVVDMKTQRIRQLEGDKMRTELELADYETLKESYQRLQRENEALTETLGMKARKNAEQSREIDQLRTELKREINEKKRVSIKYDQLEYQLNESRELLAELSYANIPPINENDQEDMETNGVGGGAGGERGVESSFSTKYHSFSSASQVSMPPPNTSRRTSSRNHVRRLFSTPNISESSQHQQQQAQFHSRQHYQHQDPAMYPNANTKHRLPELVLSSINSNWLQHKGHKAGTPNTVNNISSHKTHPDSDQASSSCSANSSPIMSPKLTDPKSTDSFNEYPNSSSVSASSN